MAIGKGDASVTVLTPSLQYDHPLSPRFSIQGKLTANHASGDLGQATAPGDAFLSGIYHFQAFKQWNVSFALGVKAPINDGNIRENNYSLPMQYQSSLGTWDVIAGVSAMSGRWQFAAGWQQPLSGENANRFLPESWSKDDALNYPPSNSFRRRGDVLLRVNRSVSVARNFLINGGVLAIYHLAEDTYRLNDTDRSVMPISGSQGLTLNLTLAAFWKLSQRFQLGVTSGAPVLFRETRPDGLTRKFVIAPEVQWMF